MYHVKGYHYNSIDETLVPSHLTRIILSNRH